MDMTLLRIILGVACCFAVYANPAMPESRKPFYEAPNPIIQGKEDVIAHIEAKLTDEEKELLGQVIENYGKTAGSRIAKRSDMQSNACCTVCVFGACCCWGSCRCGSLILKCECS